LKSAIKKAAEHIGILLVFIFASCLARREVLGMISEATCDFGDILPTGRWLYWIYEWLTFKTDSLFAIPVGYPIQNTFLQTDHIFAEGLLTVPFAPFFQQPLALYNILTFLVMGLSGYTMYLLVKEITGSRMAAFWAGLAYLMLPYRQVKACGHINLIATQFVPLTFYAIIRWFRTLDIRYAVFAGISYGLLGLSTGQLFTWMNPVIGISLIIAVVSTPGGKRAKAILHASLIVAVAASMFGYLYYSYLVKFSGLEQYYPPEAGTPIERWFSPAPLNWFYYQLLNIRTGFDHEVNIFWGVAVPVLFFFSMTKVSGTYRGALARTASVILLFGCFCSISYFTYNYRVAGLLLLAGLIALVIVFRHRITGWSGAIFSKQPSIMWLFAIFALVYTWLCFGTSVMADGKPVAWGIHDIFRTIVPGFKSSRGPGRIQIIAVLGVIVVGSFGVARILDACRNRFLKYFVFAALLFLIVLEFGQSRYYGFQRWNPSGGVPPEYLWLKNTAMSKPGIELPISQMNDFQYTYWQRFHGKSIVNFWSGYIPPWRLWLEDHRQDRDQSKVLDVLRAMGVGWFSLRPGTPYYMEIQKLPYVRPWGRVGNVSFFLLDPIEKTGTPEYAMRFYNGLIEIAVINRTDYPVVELPKKTLTLSWTRRCGEKVKTGEKKVIFEPFWAAARDVNVKRVNFDMEGMESNCTIQASLTGNGTVLARAETRVR